MCPRAGRLSALSEEDRKILQHQEFKFVASFHMSDLIFEMRTVESRMSVFVECVIPYLVWWFES